MRWPRSALILFVLLAFGLSLAVPAEDLLETACEESETQPYEGLAPFAIVLVQAAARTTQEVLGSSLHQSRPISLLAASVHDSSLNRSSNVRVSSALLCTLRC